MPKYSEDPFIDDLPSASEVQGRVNKRYEELVHVDWNGDRVPYVCTICDTYLLSEEERCQVTVSKLKEMKNILCWDSVQDDRRKVAIEEYYRWQGERNGCTSDLSFLKGMALSPHGILYKKAGRGTYKFGFSCCKRCRANVMSKEQRMPRHAIVNKNYVGVAPTCLKELSDVEIAFLSPVKSYGYCFTWTGGKQKALKGTLTFMRVQPAGIANGVNQLNELGFNQHVICLYSGSMTKAQKKKASEKCTIRVEKVTEALKWLCANNHRWKDVHLDEMIEELHTREPVVYDRTHEVDSGNENLERTELFTCYYPDGAATPTNGGFEQPGFFKEYVQDMAKQGYDVEFQLNLEKQFIKGGESDLLIDACLLQFPYGIGAMDERRLLHDGSWCTKSDLKEFLHEMSLRAHVEFQAPMFQLIMYSLISKYRLLKSSRLQLRGKTDAKNLAEGLNSGDVVSAINGRRMRNRYAGTDVSRKFLNAVDASAKALPHTNEASKAARGNGEAMQHHFGMSSVFLTVTFDDENSVLIQALSGVEVDDDTPIDSLSDAELSNRATKRRELRLDFPGIASMNFEMLFEILLEEVVGWDIRKNCPTEKPGYFGRPYAFSFAIEEQGRGTLHTHMTLWIEGYRQLQNDFFFKTGRAKELASWTLVRFHEHVASTKLFPEKRDDILKAFDHECGVTQRRKRQVPVVISDQMLRNLRNRQGYKDSGGRFAMCPDCPKVWTYEELVSDYLHNFDVVCLPANDEANLPADVDSNKVGAQIPRARMFGKCMEFQMDRNSPDVPASCINAVYQHHISCHVTNCFKCQKKGNKKRGHACGPSCECRYRLPDRKRARAEIMVEKESIPWYTWRGTSTPQPLAQIIPKRNTYDLFQNVSCDAISHTKFSCNSNVSLILDGPIGQYMHKYQNKENQDEESADYKEVESLVKKFDGERVHENDRAEALRLICRASFAHNKKNVISPCFASYLLRHESRFYYSHDFIFCPVKDVVRMHNKQAIRGILKYNFTGDCFFENAALNYLCRSTKLEGVSLRDFTERYYTGHVPNDYDADQVFPHIAETVSYKHPSVLKSGKRKGMCSQGSFLRDAPRLIRVSQWMFPDTADFKADMLTCDPSKFTRNMEEYAQLVLCLFVPHRSSADLKAEGATDFPYVKKIQEVYQEDQRRQDSGDTAFILHPRNASFLQNLQNCRSNTLRYKMNADDLAQDTEPYNCPNGEQKDEDDNADDEDDVEATAYEVFAAQLEEQFGGNSPHDNDADYLQDTLQHFKFGHMRDKGLRDCGYKDDIPVPLVEESDVDFLQAGLPDQNANVSETDPEYPESRVRYSVNEIVALHLMRRLPKMCKSVWKDKDIDVTKATGSIESIREWSKAAFSTDKKQQRAFEAITAAFLLTFYEETPEHTIDATTEAGESRTKYRRMKKALMCLRGCKKEHNMICLLHGPGGSGKSTVINCVKAYAADYCKSLGHPFTNRTIIITAMSGVAATLLNGETTHSVVGLNRDSVQQEEVDDWKDARILIVDEVSFACDNDFAKMHEHLKCFMECHYRKYGGLNVIFAGDYSQLEPVNRDPVYKDDNYCPEFHGSINCYVELDGTWRFRKDPVYGERMLRFREGVPTIEDIQTINRACHVDMKKPPVGIQIATYRNKDRDAVNAAIFEDYCKEHGRELDDDELFESACVIFMDELYMTDSSKAYVPVMSNCVKRHFYEKCSENECNHGRTGRGRVDPCLKLYPNAPMMLTKNSDVANGEANGSRVIVKSVKLKPGEQAFPLKLDCGTTVNALFASQVKAIVMEHENEDITPRRFEVNSEGFTFTCKLQIGMDEEYLSMKGTQFPIISNSCTTGHKLQGCTVDSILCNDWFYGANWAYVVLSRVKTMNGLYLRSRLSEDLKKYSKPDAMKRMLQGFKEKHALHELTEDEYDDIIDIPYVAPSTPALQHDSLAY